MASAGQPKYESVHAEDHDGSRSSTEVESLIGEEDKQWHLQRLQRSQKKSTCSWILSTLKSLRWLIDTLLLVTIVYLLLRHEKQTDPKKNAGATQVGGDITGVHPEFSTVTTRFEIDYSYAPMNASEFFENRTLDKWNALMPKGMGFVWVNDTSRYHDLPAKIEWPEKTVYTTSVTHNLHCLYAMAQTYMGLKANHSIPDDHHWHVVHCIAYMRQAIMCSADVALEGHETTFPDHNGGSDGWDATHVCKDYNQIKNYLEGVRAYDDQLIY